MRRERVVTATARSCWRFTALDPRCLLAARLHSLPPTVRRPPCRPWTSLDAPQHIQVLEDQSGGVRTILQLSAVGGAEDTAALRNFDPAYDRAGSIATGNARAGRLPMSGMGPIADLNLSAFQPDVPNSLFPLRGVNI